MSENVRELTVSLLLDGNQFERNIRTINKQIKEAESEFQKAAAGSDRFEKTLKGMREKAASLTKQLESQNKIAGQYGAKIKSLNARLEEQGKRYTQLKQQMGWEESNREEMSRKVAEQTARLKELTFAFGADSDAAKAAAEQLKFYREEQQRFEKAAAATSKELDNQSGRMRTTLDAISDASAGLNRTQAEIKELTLELNKNRSAWYTHGVAMQDFAERAQSAAQSFERVGDGLTRTVTAPLIGLGAAAAKASIDYESAFAGVKKTVQVAEEEAPAFFEQLSDSVIDMSKTLATGAGDIAEVMAIAGQLSIENDKLVEFTDTIIRLGMSTNLAGEDAATQMAKFANITGMQQDMFRTMGSTLVQLGNRFATTEADIMNMAMRIAAAGKQVGLTQPQILGFAAALSSVGLEAEAGGSAFSTALKKMEVAVATNNKQLKDFAKVEGLTTKEFKKIWENNPATAFEQFIVGLSKMDEEGIGAIATLNEIGFTQLRLSDTLLRATNATDLFRRAQTEANTEWDKGEALMKESDTRLATRASKLANIKNSVVATGIAFADVMAPEMERIINALAEGVEWFAKLDEGARKNLINWGLVAAAAGPVVKGVGAIGSTATGAIGFIGKFAQAIGTAGAVLKTTGSAAAALGAMLGPGGALMTGGAVATAVITGLIAIMNKVEAAKPDFSIDTSEIEKYRIDPVDLTAKVDVATTTTISGDILALNSKFVGILNDGLPETEEVRKELKADVDTAVGAAFGLIEEAYNAKKLELDTLFQKGVIDETTYNTAMTTLNTQAQTMKDDLTGKAEAVTGYVTTLCDNNRKMTEEEITTLNSLLKSLAATATEVGRVTDAQMQVYELAYRKTMMGMGTEEDMRKAAEYIELLHAQEQARIEAEKAAAEAVTAELVEGMSEEEQKAQIERLNDQTEALEAQSEAAKELRKQSQGGIISETLKKERVPLGDMERYLELLDELEKNGITYEDGLSWWESEKALNPLSWMIDEIKELEAIEKRLDESGVLEGDSPINAILSTLAADGMIAEEALSSTAGVVKTLAELVTGVDPAIDAVAKLKTGVEAEAENIMPGATQAVEDGTPEFVAALQGAAAAGSEIFPKAYDMHSPSRLMYGQGLNIMAGLRNGIRDGTDSVVGAMRRAARAAVSAAKAELDINSPSKVFEDEVGRMAIKGLGKGVEEETKAQAQAMRNAAKYLTGEAQTGAAAGAGGNSRTYNSESHVTVQVDKFIANDRQDIQALATEIAGLTRQQQRGRGLKHA